MTDTSVQIPAMPDTPMMEQYRAYKEQYKDCILFFRLGDFYEMFFEDALIASELLGITLTSRHKEQGIPMAGVPHHSAEGYIRKLLDAGRKVALCEQVEKADKKKKMLARRVVRIFTPGTVVEESSLEEGISNYLLAVVSDAKKCIALFADVSCGDVLFTRLASEQLADMIKTISPKEIITAQPLPGIEAAIIDAERFDCWVPSEQASRYIEQCAESLLDAQLGKALNIMLFYLDMLYFGELPPLREPAEWSGGNAARLDANTIAHLEIEKTLIGGERAGTLLWAVDRTKTAIGKRHLRNIIRRPLRAIEEITARQNEIAGFYEAPVLLDHTREKLSAIKDIERTMARLLVKRGGPRELVMLARSLKEAIELVHALAGTGVFPLLAACVGNNTLTQAEVSAWEEVFIEEPPLNWREGGFLNSAHSADASELMQIINGSRDLIVALEEREKAATGINSLKIGFTRVFGYYIEVSKRFSDKVPQHYIRKQTTVNGERYFTAELKELEDKILNARERLTEHELAVLEKTVQQVELKEAEILQLARFVAWADVFSSFAFVARERRWERPLVSQEPGIQIIDGRHPVVEAMLGKGKYVPASISLGDIDSRFAVITGPNMGGKSTLMRKVALITLLAQIGSFVPAGRAKIGVVDAIFTRVGASDNLSRGESTFLVEMKESAHILNNSTRDSLIILDEIGRGTGTFDGISIARAIAEHLIEKTGAIVLFATHYHMLTELADDFSSVRNFHMAVREYKDSIQFLYQLKDGGSSRSFGVEVAKLAGMPLSIIKSAEKHLSRLERVDRQVRLERGGSMQLDIFSLASIQAENSSHEDSETIKRLRDDLEGKNPDTMAPRDALDIYYRIYNILFNEETSW